MYKGEVNNYIDILKKLKLFERLQKPYGGDATTSTCSGSLGDGGYEFAFTYEGLGLGYYNYNF